MNSVVTGKTIDELLARLKALESRISKVVSITPPANKACCWVAEVVAK